MAFAIYKITNLSNGKIYFGQTLTPEKRWVNHKWRAKRGEKHPLYASMRKHGVEQFVFEVVDRNARTEIQLDQLERYYIAEWNTRAKNIGYNLAEGGHTNRGWKQSPEAIRKSVTKRLGAKRPEFGASIMGEDNPFYGRTHSHETRARIARNRKGIAVDNKCKGKTWKLVDGVRIWSERGVQ